MTKLVNDLIEEDEREAWEYEHSIELACEFVQNDIIPLLEDFESNTQDANYITGSAVHALFVTILYTMVDMGYTVEELKDEIDNHMNSSAGETLH